MARKRRVGSRRLRNRTVFEETGFDSSAAEAQAMKQLADVDAKLAMQDRGVNEALDRSNAAREKLASKGIFGGLN